MSKAFPGAPILTTLYDSDATYPEFASLDVRATWLNRVRGVRGDHRRALPMLPLAVAGRRVDADVLLCSSSGWSHGFRTTGKKIVYCYSPARWLYQTSRYIGESTPPHRRLALGALKKPLVWWDRRQAATANGYIAISSIVQRRVRDAYGLEAPVLPAPHSMSREMALTPVRNASPGFFLCVSRLLPYKNVLAVVEAFKGRSERLLVVGRGPQLPVLRSVATSNVCFKQDLTDSEMAWLYSHCQAVIAASHEDFGLTPVEGAVFGAPAIVLRYGGFLDTVIEGVTGAFFNSPTAADIRECLDRVRDTVWSTDDIQHHAECFSEQHFATALQSIIRATVGAA